MDKTKKTFEQMVPEEYQQHARTFNEKQSHQFPPTRTWDHAIELLPDAPKAFDCKIYPMARGEEDSLQEFIKLDIRWGYNNVHIKEGDQENSAFNTLPRLYAPCLVFLRLTNPRRAIQ